MFFLMAHCSTCGENTDGTSGVFSQKEARWSGGVQVECWLYNEHYSAQMAVQRGLSVQGPETLWLDFPCVAILLCPWMVSLFLHLPFYCSETVQWISFSYWIQEIWFLFNAYMRGPVIMTFISREGQIQPYIVGCSVLVWHDQYSMTSWSVLLFL